MRTCIKKSIPGLDESGHVSEPHTLPSALAPDLCGNDLIIDIDDEVDLAVDGGD